MKHQQFPLASVSCWNRIPLHVSQFFFVSILNYGCENSEEHISYYVESFPLDWDIDSLCESIHFINELTFKERTEGNVFLKMSDNPSISILLKFIVPLDCFILQLHKMLHLKFYNGVYDTTSFFWIFVAIRNHLSSTLATSFQFIYQAQNIMK